MESIYLNEILTAKQFGSLMIEIIINQEEHIYILLFNHKTNEFKKAFYNFTSIPFNNSIFKRIYEVLKCYIVKDKNNQNIFSIAQEIFSLTEIFLNEEYNETELETGIQSDLKLFKDQEFSTYVINKYLPLNEKFRLIYQDYKIEKFKFAYNFEKNKELNNFVFNIRTFISKNICHLFIYTQQIAINGSVLINGTNEKYFAMINSLLIPLLSEIFNFGRFRDLSIESLNVASMNSKMIFETDLQISNFIDYIQFIN